ncbi:hypothetical protein SKAU_G00145340 [Synaphobranchus kaupii]|uniref:Uncharacterized protein n=1 Tax=Synaphobranchus kaupii TaxID=118154 RepID=A0A9Q1J4P0_SYNKA|nr:hypothetical protein SKAU_G00145340 [Synaphobranchus kaupii]
MPLAAVPLHYLSLGLREEKDGGTLDQSADNRGAYCIAAERPRDHPSQPGDYRHSWAGPGLLRRARVPSGPLRPRGHRHPPPPSSSSATISIPYCVRALDRHGAQACEGEPWRTAEPNSAGLYPSQTRNNSLRSVQRLTADSTINAHLLPTRR